MADEKVKCPNCGAQNQLAGKFCEQCGNRVPAPADAAASAPADEAPTDANGADEAPTDALDAQSTNGAPQDGAAGDTAPLRFVRLVGGTFKAEHAFDVPVDSRLMIGRTDPANGVFPEVDVTMWAQRVATSQGELYTIHRKQCYISRDAEGQVWIVDHAGYEGDTLVAPPGASQFHTIPSLHGERDTNDEGAIRLEVGDRVLMGQGEGMLIFQLVVP